VASGSASFTFTIGGQASREFRNATAINIPASGPADLYPSVINVANLGGTITKVTATLTNLTHTFPDDLDILLVGPGGEKVTLMSDAGGTSAQPNPLTNVRIEFDEAASVPLPDTGLITSGTYAPANYAGFGTADAFPAPAPSLPYTNTSLSVFNGLSPIGDWSLFIVDDTGGDAGFVSAGWGLLIETSDPVTPSPSTSEADLAVAASLSPNPVPVGGIVSCHVTVRNNGPADANLAATLSDMPVGLTFVSASASTGTWKQVGSTMTWQIGTLEDGATATLTVDARATAAGELASSITVSANEIDPTWGNNSAVMVANVVEVPALTVTRQSDSVRLSWPAAGGFILQVSDGLSPAVWSDVEGSPQEDAGESIVVVDGAGAGRFYRLRSP
jgi:uncharacterized repeat protein (TIGR01451 family)